MPDPLFAGEIWERAFYGNTVYEYFVAVLLFVALSFVFKLVQWVVLRSVVNITKRTRTELDDALVEVVKTIRPQFYIFLAFYVALQYLSLTGIADTIMDAVLLVWVVYQVIVAVRIIIDVYVQHRIASTDDKMAESIAHVIHSLVSVVLWALGILFILQNLGVNVTSLIAGLGVGGIAVALAAQSLLGDLFSSMAIYFDKPFVPGDFIAFGSESGTVQKVGIKTTRIRHLGGEELIVPNTNLTNVHVHNYGRMEERRAVFSFGVTYETPTEKMKDIPGIVEQIINEQEEAHFGRCHFHEFADSSLNYQVVYFAETKEYAPYMDMNQDILLKIKDALAEQGIEMAYPTRTIHMHQMG